MKFIKTAASLLLTAWALSLAPQAGAIPQTATNYFLFGTNDLGQTNFDAANLDFSNAVTLSGTNITPIYNVFYAMSSLLALAWNRKLPRRSVRTTMGDGDGSRGIRSQSVTAN